MRTKLFVLLLCFVSNINASSRAALRDYEKKDFPKAEEKLKEMQIDHPYDPSINYNLGVVQYLQNKFEDAKESFNLVLKHSKEALVEEATFNLGNSLYKNTLAMLGENWEEKKLEDKVIESAIKEVKDSIEKYTTLLSKKPEDEKAKDNKKAAEDLLKKLEKKQEQQKQDKDKKDQDKKDNKDQQDQNQDKKNQQDQKDKQDQRDKDKQCEDQDKKQEPEKKQDEQGGNSKDQKKASDPEMQNMEALLDSIESKEEKTQKALIKHALAGNMQKRNSNQKNW